MLNIRAMKQPEHVTVIIVLISLVSLLLGSAGISHAAAMPVYERLSPINARLDAPTAVALDSEENIYVAESIKNRIRIFSQSGAYVDTLSGLSKPISVAVDSKGRIYVGSRTRGNVEVYDKDLTLLFSLGAGEREFGQPGAISIDSMGKVYVADSKKDMIKIYNPDGSFNFSFGSYGSEDGQFNFPTSIAIDESAGEIIITDLHLIQSWMGTNEGAKIKIFDMNGAFKRSIGEFGQGDGMIFKPMGVAVDGLGRIYVTDSYQQAVQIFDLNGLFLGSLYDVDNQMRTPVGISITNSNRLLIASLNTGSVEVYGIDLYTQMEVSPLFLSYSGTKNSAGPAVQNIMIKNTGTAILNWSASASHSWITLSDASGSTDPGNVSDVGTGINLEGLTPGTYKGNVTISADTGQTETVDIELVVEAMPELSVLPAALEFISLNGSIPEPQTISITDAAGEAVFNWSASSDSNWIVLSKQSGTAPDAITVSIEAALLTHDTYTGVITVAGYVVQASPVTIPVTLRVINARGKIKVSTNIESATFIINGPMSYKGRGRHWRVRNVPAGSYAIVYGDVEGHITPPSQVKKIKKGNETTFKGRYVKAENRSTKRRLVQKNIITGAGPGAESRGLVKVFNYKGKKADLEFLAHKYRYGVKVAAGDINNDGSDEIITAPGPGPENPAELSIFNNYGKKITRSPVSVFPYSYGAHVASADLNGDGYDEIIAGAGEGGGNPAEVKVLMYDPDTVGLREAGIHFIAHENGSGCRIAAADIDGDRASEIITYSRTGKNSIGEVRIWKVETSSGAGQWSASLVKEFRADAGLKGSTGIAGADINGDGLEEIITAGNKINVLDQVGDLIAEFGHGLMREGEVSIAAEDLDADGIAEVILSTHRSNKAQVRILDSSGDEKKRFYVLDTDSGVNLTVGNLGLK